MIFSSNPNSSNTSSVSIILSREFYFRLFYSHISGPYNILYSKETQGNIGRTEVHMANYAPTSLGTTALFGMSNDASADNNMLNIPKKGYYISTEGLAWGICIPGTEVWKWPKEYKIITDVYPGFKNWVINGGKIEDLDWISNHTNDIFVKP